MLRLRYLLPSLLTVTLAAGIWSLASAATPDSDKGDPTKPDVGGGSKGDAKELDLIHPNDATALKEHMGREIAVEGKVSRAEWSKSGKVMTIDFAEATDSKFMAAAFAKAKDALDTAFGGDVTKAITGKKVRITGVLKDFKGRPEIMVDKAEQIELIAEEKPKS